MKTLIGVFVALATAFAPAVAGTWMISNSKGFSSNPVVDASGMPLTGLDPVIVAVGTFASEPAAPLSGSGANFSSVQYASLLAEFTAFGPVTTLVQPESPLNLLGVFDFQHDGAVLATPLAGKPVYVIVAKGASLTNATEVTILRTNAVFNTSEDENALPKLIGVGVTLGTTVIAGSSTLHMASASNLDPTLEPAFSLATLLAGPDIAVEDAEGNPLFDETSTLDFGISAPGTAGNSQVLTIRNTGSSELTDLSASIGAADETSFVLDLSGFAESLAPGTATGFSIRFTPQHSGPVNATLSIASNDGDEDPFEIALSGTALSFTVDTDSDGLNDATEFQWADLGFIWNEAQPTLVATLFSNLAGALPNLNAAGFFNPDQVQALHAGVPLIQRDSATGVFTLTMDWKKSTDLSTFLDFPAQPPGVSVNPQGDIEFKFTSPDNAAFFRVETD